MTPAILFIIFNRPEPAKKVFETIRQVKPLRLYVAADGARENKIGEKELCEQTRLIIKNVDWDCQVKTFFQEKNLGCGIGVSTAISWFFEKEEMGIILEDDCLPNKSFFRYCGELLEKYKNNNKISIISGNNFQKGKKRGDYSYFFSDAMNIWGWATWANRWKDFKLNVSELNENIIVSEIKKRFPEKRITNLWIKIYEQMKNNEIDTWDYQFYFSQLERRRIFVVPNVNLISNIGFNAAGTHTLDVSAPNANIPTQNINFPLAHPTEISANHKADVFLFDNFVLRKKSLFKRILNKLRKYFISLFLTLNNSA